MPVQLHVHKSDNDGVITLTHTFYAPNENAAYEAYDEHRSQCPELTRAYDEGLLIDELEEIDRIPLADDFEDDEEDENAEPEEDDEDEEPGEEGDEEA
jgi:hypothetical protein